MACYIPLPYLIALLICFLASLTNYMGKPQPLYLKLFPPFILLTILIEYIGSYTAHNRHNNLLMFNVFTTFELIFYFYVFYSIFQDFFAKKVMLYIICTYPCLALTNILFIQGRDVFHTYTYILGGLLILGCSSYYLIGLMKKLPSNNLVVNPELWIVKALLFFYCSSIPWFWIAMNYFTFIKRTMEIINDLRFSISLVNIIFYSLFTVAFLCKIELKKIL